MIPVDLLPESHWESWCVAGGWAACPSLAGDQDIWLFEPKNCLKQLRLLVLQHLEEQNFIYTEEGQAEAGSSYSPSFGILKIAAIELPKRQHTIHLLATSHPSAEKLIETFDISTHQIAITHDGNVVLGSKWTPVTMAPKVIAVNQGKPTTPARMTKITARYRYMGDCS